MPKVQSKHIANTPTTGLINHTIPEITNTIAHFLYKAAIFSLYSATFLTFDFNVVSPLQKLIGSLLSLLKIPIIKKGNAHIKQDIRPIIFPNILFTSTNSYLSNYATNWNLLV